MNKILSSMEKLIDWVLYWVLWPFKWLMWKMLWSHGYKQSWEIAENEEEDSLLVVLEDEKDEVSEK